MSWWILDRFEFSQNEFEMRRAKIELRTDLLACATKRTDSSATLRISVMGVHHSLLARMVYA